MAQVTPQARLCPHCANSIPADASSVRTARGIATDASSRVAAARVTQRAAAWPLRRASQTTRWRWIGLLAFGLLIFGRGRILSFRSTRGRR